jgi:hypothetical protein
MGSISQYAVTKDRSIIEPDVYPATISHCSVVMENGLPKLDQYGKTRLLVRVTLDDETGPDGGPIELQRSLAISYGRNSQTGVYAAMAQLIQAATGIPCGDKAQPHVMTEDLLGKPLRVQTDNVESNGAVYTNIVSFLPVKKRDPKAAPAAKPVPPQFQHKPAAAPEPEPDYDEQEIPF